MAKGTKYTGTREVFDGPRRRALEGSVENPFTQRVRIPPHAQGSGSNRGPKADTGKLDKPQKPGA